MGASYLLLTADHPEGQAQASRRLATAGWQEAVARPAFSLWTRTSRPLQVRRFGDLLVVGEVWRKPGRAAAAEPPDFGGLLADWHGGYVAVRPPTSDGAIEVLRDPSGALDVLTWRSSGVTCVADDLQGAPGALWPDAMALDWNVISGFFRDPVSVWGPSALTGVRALAPGEILRLNGRACSVRPAWRPAAFAGRPDAAAAPEDLVAVVTECVAACAGSHEKLLLEVSGGLDSAIVATSLAAAGQSWRVARAVNQFAAEAESDERALAREVCAAAEVRLHCARKPIGRLDEADLTLLANGVRPAPQAGDFIRDRMLAKLAARCGATAILTGQGGDAVFYQMPTPLVAADLLQARGWRAAFGPDAQATARWLRRSLWSLMCQPGSLAAADLVETAFHHWLGARARDVAGPGHPWLCDVGRAPPGKQIQIQALCAAQMKFGRTLRAESLVVRHPLLTQPVVEFCLGVPSWRLTGGRDRGFARTAFAHRLPPRVARRRSKGVLSVLYGKRMVQSLDLLRPWLLEGVLCRAEVLDRTTLEAALTPEALLWEGQASRLAWAALIEGWARWWQGRVPDASGIRSRSGT